MSADALPVIGAGGGGGGKGGGGGAPTSYAPQEIADSLRSKAYIDIIYAIGEGPCKGLVNGGRSVFLDDVPLVAADGSNNFPGAWHWERFGWQSQSPIFNDTTASADNTVGVEVKYNDPWVHRITDDEVDSVVVTLGYPQMAHQNPKTGQVGGTSVLMGFYVQVANGGYAMLPIGYGPVSGHKHSKHLLQAATFAYDCRFTVRAPGAKYRKLKVSVGLSFDSRSTYDANFDLFYDDRRDSAVGTGTVRWDAGGEFYVWFEPNDGGDWDFDVESFTFYGRSYTHEVNGKCLQRYQQQFRINRPSYWLGGPWDIKVERRTPDSTTSSVANQTWVDGYREETMLALGYPNTALIALRLPAEHFSSVPEVRFDYFGLYVSVPSNYFPHQRRYTRDAATGNDTGTLQPWDGSFRADWSCNPAWCLWAVLHNKRWALGEHEIPADKWTFYAIARYCDEAIPDGNGGAIPRFECHLSIDTQDEAYNWLKVMTACFRGMLYVMDGLATAVADRPTDPEYLFNNTNVVDGRFEYSGSSETARHTAVYVTWKDPADNGNDAVEYIPDQAMINRYGLNPAYISAPWVRRKRHAHLLGEWLLETEKRCTQVVTFRASTAEAAFLRPGAIVDVADANRAGERRGGRVISHTDTSVEIDAQINLRADIANTLKLIAANGTVIERAIRWESGWTQTIHFWPALDTDLVSLAAWCVSSANVQPQRYRILEIEEAADGTSQITALEHEPTLFAHIERDKPFVDTKIASVVPGPPQIPPNVLAEEALYVAPDGVIANRITVHWMPAKGAIKYHIRWRMLPGNWVSGGSVADQDWDLEDGQPGVYQFAVSSESALRRRSAERVIGFRALGKTALPPNVTSMRVIALRDGKRRAVFGYAASVKPLDLRGYEIRYIRGAVGAGSWNRMIPLHTGILTASPWEFALAGVGTYTFGVVGVDTSGNKSALPRVTVVNLPAPQVDGDVIVTRSAREAGWPGETTYS
jgi:predicted phage tail protein